MSQPYRRLAPPKWISLLLMIMLVVRCPANAASSGSERQTVSFDADWRFHLGEVKGAEAADFSDADWRKLDLPHDWMIEQPFDRKSPAGAGGGYLDGGVGWYRKTFKLGDVLEANSPDQHIFIQFDGVYMDSDVWLNGQHLGNHPYGYTSFQYDLTEFIKRDAPNELAVRCNVVQPCSRFYSGAGIYRHVWLTATAPVHVDHWGSFVTSDVHDKFSIVTVRTTVANDGDQPEDVVVDWVLTDPDGNVTQLAPGTPVHVEARKTAETTKAVVLGKTHLWSIDTPALYHLKTIVHSGGAVADTDETPFGIRSIQFTVDQGFLLNGKHVAIHGVCDHHDLGCLGAAVNRRAMQRQLEILKSFGVNGIRTSHYPPDPELLDLCDEMGFVVMDEAFDEWKRSKTKFGYGRFFDEWSEPDLVSMLRRDRNHPSVVLWSVGNEIPEQSSERGDTKADPRAMVQRLVDICHREDPTRWVTSALSLPGAAIKSGFAAPLDVFGVNYAVGFYASPEVHGKKPMIGSETSSDVSSRGEYGLSIKSSKIATTQRADNQVSSYDTYHPPWATTAQTDLLAVRNAPWLAGEFVWTGFDYIGEPTPFGWPSRSSYFGVVDLCGFPKDRYYLYQSQWTDKPVVHLLPHWTWPGLEGQPIDVRCYTNADAVELFLNGKSLGSRDWTRTKDLYLDWSVPYAPGELKAVASKNGKVIGTDVVATAGDPAKILLTADRSALATNVRDLSYVTATIVDAAGHVCPNASNQIQFDLSGPAIIAGTDNGDATDLTSFQSKQRKVFHGLGLAVIQAGRLAGAVKLTASAQGLASATVTLTIEKPAAAP
jgi:beta-galactosidase